MGGFCSKSTAAATLMPEGQATAKSTKKYVSHDGPAFKNDAEAL